MVTAEELQSDAEYNDIKDEISNELRKYGQLVEVIIPRSGENIGAVYGVFQSDEHAASAAKAVAGRVFAGRTITVTFETV